MQNLPKWVLPPTMPSIYETETFTSLEAVARLYGAVRQLIEEYNAFSVNLKNEVDSFEATSSGEIESFKKEMERRLACKFKDLNAEMNAAKTELTKFAISWLEENTPDGALPVVTAADDGKIMMASGGAWVPVYPAFTYNAETESLTLNILGG